MRIESQKTYRSKRLTCAAAFAAVIVLLLVMFMVSVDQGSIDLSVKQLIRGLFVEYDDTVATVYDLRFPRMMISMLVGAALAVSGVLLQAVLKNPLTDPGIIGISGGASFTAVIMTALAPQLFYFLPVAAFLGGLLAFILVYSLSWKGGLSPLRIILVGVAVSTMFSGLSSAIDAMSGGNQSLVASIVNGSITMKTWDDVNIAVIYLPVFLLLAVCSCRICNLMSLDDKTARGIGLSVDRWRILISLIAVVLASVSTAVAGIVSFVGLIVPHIARMLVGSDHKVLIPFSILLGALLFLTADTLGRTIAAPYEISASVIMAVAGGPFFIILLKGKGNYGS